MKNKSLFDSFSNALNGVIHALINERNFRLHFITAILVLIVSLFLNLSVAEYLIVLLTITLVLVSELVNTAIESATDLLSKGEYHYLAKIAKDTAAGAVFISSLAAVAVGYLLIISKILKTGITQQTLLIIRQTPAQITLVCIIVTIMVTVVVKALTKSESLIQGGMPSSHSALAFSAATCIFFMTSNEMVIFLSYFLAFLVMQSRIEGKIHSFVQAIIGGILGILVTAFIYQIWI